MAPTVTLPGLPAQGQQDDLSYWGFVLAVLMFLFLLFVTSRGELSKWLALLVLAPATAPTVPNAGFPAASPATPGKTAATAVKSTVNAVNNFIGPRSKSAYQNLPSFVSDFIKGLGQ